MAAQVYGRKQDNGWTSVIYKHKFRQTISQSRSEGGITLFVDNIPEFASVQCLKGFLTSSGLVTDAFIPNKRSKISGSCFGFVRYDCKISVEVVVSKANDIWYLTGNFMSGMKCSFQDIILTDWRIIEMRQYALQRVVQKS